MKTFDYYKNKESQLNKALKRIETMLKECETGKRDVETWNDIHYLQSRIENRLIDNLYEYKGWQLENNGFCVINY